MFAIVMIARKLTFTVPVIRELERQPWVHSRAEARRFPSHVARLRLSRNRGLGHCEAWISTYFQTTVKMGAKAITKVVSKSQVCDESQLAQKNANPML